MGQKLGELVRVYYFDDSGDRGKDPNAPYLVVGGFGIDADQLPALKAEVLKVAEKFGFPMSHPSELKFNQVGRKKDDKPNKPHWMIRAGLNDMLERRAFVYAVLRAALRITSVKVLAVAVDQGKTYGSKKPIELAMDPLFERIQMDAVEHSTIALVMMDEEQADDKALRHATRAGSAHVRYTNIMDTISFMPSEESPGIQVADLVAGSIGRYMNYGDPGYLRVFWHKVRAVNGARDRFGIKVYPSGACLAPAVHPTPWPPLDRSVHNIEMMRVYGKAVEWSASGKPSWHFPDDDKRP